MWHRGIPAPALLSIVALAVLALLAVAQDAEAADIYIGDDWVINTQVVYEWDNITVRGDIDIQDGGSLTLRNSTLRVDSRENSRKDLVVHHDGAIYVYDSTITSRFTNNNNERYYFEVWNDSVFVNSDISRLYGWNRNGRGLRLMGGDHHLIEGCKIHSSTTYGVYAQVSLTIRETEIWSTSWARLAIETNDEDNRLEDKTFIIDNCTFTGDVGDPYSYGVWLGDNYGGHWEREVNITYCNFAGLSYGVYVDAPWQVGLLEMSYNEFDRCTYGERVEVNFMDIFMHHNRYSVRSGGVGIWLYQGSYGNITWNNEDIRGSSAGHGTAIQLRGAGSVRHLVHDMYVLNTYYGINHAYGPAVVRDCVIDTTSNVFTVSGGATIDVYTTEHEVGSGFVENSGGRITVWQRLNVSSVRWSDGTDITEGFVHLVNETDFDIGSINLSRGESFLDFKRWEAKRLYIWINARVFPALLDVDTYFRADELDIAETAPQDIVFTDDYVPRLTLPGFYDGMRHNVSYLILEGAVVERGRGLSLVEVSRDGGGSWSTAAVENETWQFAWGRMDDGPYEIHARATDRAGNRVELAFEDFVVDTEEPPLDMADVPQETNDPILNVTGTTERGATLYLGDMVAESDENGSFTLLFPLDEGANGLVLRVRDSAGNWNQRVFSVILDTIVPSLKVTSPGDGLVTNEGLVYFAGRTDEDVKVTIDGTRVSTYIGGFAEDVELPEGEHLVRVVATDTAGNEAVVVVGVTVDLTPPQLVIDDPPFGTGTTTEETASIAGRTDSDIDHVFVNSQNRSALPGEFAIQVDLVQGPNEFTVVVRDRAGNENRTKVVLTRDNLPPKVHIHEVTVKDGSIVEVGTDKYATGDTLVMVLTTNEDTVFTVRGEDHRGTDQVTVELVLEEGTNTISVEAKDLMANPADPMYYTIIYDSTAPLLSVNYPEEGDVIAEEEVVIRGRTDDGTVKVWISGKSAGVRNDGTFEMTVVLEEGENSFDIRAEDSAGNEATTTLTIRHEEEEVVKESSATLAVIALVIGLAVGAGVMYALSARARGDGGREPGPPYDRDSPPPPPPEQRGEDGGWREY